MNICMPAAEMPEFAPLGGLGVAVGGLSKGLAARGHRVTVTLPGYEHLQDGAEVWSSAIVPAGAERAVRVRAVQVGQLGGVNVIALQADSLFHTGIYDLDQIEQRFITFGTAADAFASAHPFDVVNGHDWHCATILERMRVRDDRTRVGIMTVHNATADDYRRPLDADKRELLRPVDSTGVDDVLQLGLRAADGITVVSQAFFDQMLAIEGLARFLRKRPVAIVRNGLDYEALAPERNTNLVANFGVDSLDDRGANTRWLREYTGLHAEDESVPIVAMVARLEHQKGVDVVLDDLEAILALGAQVVVMGRGSLTDVERRLREAADQYPGRFAYIARDEPWLAQRVFAGATLMLHPSRAEPFGLAILEALALGAPSAYHDIDGMRENVTRHGLGFPFTGLDGLVGAIREALDLFRNHPEEWRALQQKCLMSSFDWTEPVSALEQFCWQRLQRRRAGLA